MKGQTVTVRDDVTRQPLEFVTIHSGKPSASALTDVKGRADLAGFTQAGKIEFRLIGYKPLTLSYKQVSEARWEVFMSQSDISLDEVVISTNRWEQEKRDVPNMVTTIRPIDVTLQNPQTAADMISTSGYVFMQKSQLGGGSPMIRGFAANRVLIVMDGVRMNTAIFRSGNLQNVISLDPFAVEKTEMDFGPGSVIYGSDAIGGVMNFYTLSPKYSSGDKPLFRGSATARWSSANVEKTGHLDFNIGLKKWSFLSSITWSDFDDLKMGSNGPDDYKRPEYAGRINGQDTVLVNEDPLVQKPSAYDQINIMQKIGFMPRESLRFNYGFHYSATSDYSRYDRLIRYRKDTLRSAEWYYGPQVWMMNTLNISHSGENGLYDNLSVTLSQQYFEESRHDRDFGDTKLMHRTEQVEVFSVNIDLEKNLGDRHRLFYGLEGLLNNVSSAGTDGDIVTGTEVPGPARYPDPSTWNSFAGYLNYRYKPTEKMTIQTGLRYNLVTLDATFDTTFYPFPFTSADLSTGAVTGSAGLAWRPSERWQVNLNLSTGFRAPNVDDLGKVFDSGDKQVILPNPGLKAEYAWNAEAGITRIFADRIRIDITGYYTLLDNAMVRRDFTLNGLDSLVYDGEMSRIQAIQNAAQAFVYGVQAGVEMKLPYGIGFISRFNYQKGEEELDDGSTAPLRHAAPWFGSTHLTWKADRVKVDIYGLYNGEVTFDDMAPSEQDKTWLYALDENGNPWAPGWYTLNLKAMYQATDFLMVSAGLENITDQRYRPYSSGITAPGRNLILALKATF
ncbi:MAG: TonB-dependent receptor [Bacteroidales bacterium]|nr:TonB-dependent receptor [Bacteroidales bacterium]